MRKLIALIAFYCVACACRPVEVTSPAATPATDTYISQLRIINAMSADYPTVQWQVRWVPCGEENASYTPSTYTIEICTEIESHPGAAILFAAHEMGHAVAYQMAGVSDENAADEVGALAMLRHGYGRELLDASRYYLALPIHPRMPFDPHPTPSFRAWHMACMAAGAMATEDRSMEVSPACTALYQATRVFWSTRLGGP